MKKLLLFCLCTAWASFSFGQLADGSVLNQTITGTDVVTGEQVDIFQWLDDDKVVIVDVFATWCGPCWSFHQSGMLEDLYDQYGPDGEDVLRIVGAEADNTTTQADLEGTGTNTTGDWLDGVHYNMVDNASWASYFSVSYYPSIFVIRPNKGVFHMYGDEYRQFINDPAWWDRALGFSDTPNDMLASVNVPSGSVCDPEERVVAEIFNFGTNDIEEAIFDMTINGEDAGPITFLGPIEPFRKVSTSSQPFALEQGLTNIELASTSINGEAIPEDRIVNGSGTLNYYPIEEPAFTLRVHTDANPSETSGKVYDDLGATIKSFGPFDEPFTTYNFEVQLPFPQEDVECLKILIFDGGSNGMSSWDGTGQQPGIELLDWTGDVLIKPIIEGNEPFSILRIDSPANAFTSSIVDTEIVTGISIFPNPVQDVMNVNLELLQAEYVTIQLRDAMGRLYNQQRIIGQVGTNNVQMDVSQLSSGFYLVETNSDKGIRTEKVLIQR